MKNNFYALFLFAGLIFQVIFSSVVKADTIVSFSDLQFHSKFEKEAFIQLEKSDNPEYFRLFLAADESVTEDDYQKYSKRIDNLLLPFHKKSFNKLKEKKKIKKLFDYFQEQMMDKYDENALFSDLFKNGEYQCVTSSMLFAHIFDILHIPYEIDFVPTHVYLTAFPETSKIIVQTTQPEKGIITYDKIFKRNFVDYLRRNKLISKDEYEHQNTDELFTRFYLKSDTADLRQLASMQYLNLGLSYLKEQEITKSFENILKADYLNPDEKNNFLLALTLGMRMDNMDPADSLFTRYYVILYKLTKSNINRKLMTSVFDLITEKQLTKNGNVNGYKRTYRYLKQNIPDSTLMSQISFLYYYNLGNWYYNRHKPFEAKPRLLKAFVLQPEDQQIQSLLTGAIALQMDAKKDNVKDLTGLYDSTMILFENYPVLQKNPEFVNLLYHVELSLTAYYYYLENIKEGMHYKNEFEDLQNKTGIEVNTKVLQILERTYSSMAVYYYKRNMISKAKTVLEQALKYYPQSYNLKKRLEAISY